MEKIIKLTIIIRIKEKDMDKIIFPEEKIFVKKGAIVIIKTDKKLGTSAR